MVLNEIKGRMNGFSRSAKNLAIALTVLDAGPIRTNDATRKLMGKLGGSQNVSDRNVCNTWKLLQGRGLMERVQVPGAPSQFAYVRTEAGSDFCRANLGDGTIEDWRPTAANSERGRKAWETRMARGGLRVRNQPEQKPRQAVVKTPPPAPPVTEAAPQGHPLGFAETLSALAELKELDSQLVALTTKRKGVIDALGGEQAVAELKELLAKIRG